MLGQTIVDNIDEIVNLWSEEWRNSDYPYKGISEAALKDKLPLQLLVIGQQLQKGHTAELTAEMWKQSDRLDPEERASQGITIEEVVHEYRILVNVIRSWVSNHQLKITFDEFSYFYQSVFELTAEAVRRYSKHNAEQVSKDRGEYLAGIAHQMRNPLAVLSGQLDLCELRSGNLDQEGLDRLRRNVDRLLFLVNGVMRLERFKSEDLPVHASLIYPADLLDKILWDRQFDARNKGLSLEIQVDRSLQMKTDPDLFIDALGNLIENAIKYTNQGIVTVAMKALDHSVLFTVQDTGPGISLSRQKQLFHLTQPNAAGGVGIGLTIVKRAVDALSGEVEVQSQLNQGSTFLVRLPREVGSKNLPNTVAS